MGVNLVFQPNQHIPHEAARRCRSWETEWRNNGMKERPDLFHLISPTKPSPVKGIKCPDMWKKIINLKKAAVLCKMGGGSFSNLESSGRVSGTGCRRPPSSRENTLPAMVSLTHRFIGYKLSLLPLLCINKKERAGRKWKCGSDGFFILKAADAEFNHWGASGTGWSSYNNPLV